MAFGQKGTRHFFVKFLSFIGLSRFCNCLPMGKRKCICKGIFRGYEKCDKSVMIKTDLGKR